MNILRFKIMDITLQNQVTKFLELNDNNDALVNILFEYCDKIKEAPTSANLFDILVLLKHLKKYSKELRVQIEQLEDCL